MPTHNTRDGIEETEKVLWCVERMLDGTYKSAEHKKLDILNYLKRTLTTHHQELQKAREQIYSDLYSDLLRTEAILAQRNIDGEDEFSEEACYNRGYFEAVDDIAKKVAKLKDALTTDQSELDQPIS